MEISFNEVTGKGYVSEPVELTGSVFGLHLEFGDNNNDISVWRSCGGTKYVCAKDIKFVGKTFDATFTDGIAGMNIIIKCNNEPDTAVILE